jgi:hypothetical protein
MRKLQMHMASGLENPKGRNYLEIYEQYLTTRHAESMRKLEMHMASGLENPKGRNYLEIYEQISKTHHREMDCGDMNFNEVVHDTIQTWAFIM